MKGILGSVGKSGKNIRSDVALIQELLNHKIRQLHGEKKLQVDGVIGNKTINLITKYQKDVMKMIKPDGRVDPAEELSHLSMISIL